VAFFFTLRDAVQALVPSSDVGSVSDSANDVTSQCVGILRESDCVLPSQFFPPMIAYLSKSRLLFCCRYVDAAARAATLRATHAQLVLLMKKADTVDSVLKVPMNHF